MLALAFVFAGQAGNAQQTAKDPPLQPRRQDGEPSAATQVPNAKKEPASRAVEKPGFQIVSLKFQKASELAALISSVFKQSSTNGNDAVASLRIVADERTNSLLVAAPPALMAEVAGLIQKLDIQATKSGEDGRALKVFPLKKGLSLDDESLMNALNMLFTHNPNAKYTLDSTRNALFVYGDEKIQSDVEGLCESLVELSEQARQNGVPARLPVPAMQIRLLWLVDVENKEIGRPLSGEVLTISPVLAKLGIVHPRLVGNCLVNTSGGTFKSLGKAFYNGGESFVRMNGSCQMVGKHPTLKIDLRINSQDDPAEPGSSSMVHLETEIQAPFGHYVILGMTPTSNTTSVFVVQVTAAE
jgi:hypothetical protein